MAIFEGAGGNSRLPSYTGRIYIRNSRGRLLFCRWPRKRGKLTDPQAIYRADKFKQAAQGAKYCTAEQMAMSRQFMQGTSYMESDMLISAMYGKFATIQLADGSYVRSYGVLNNVSQNLDILGNTPGALMYRSPTQWSIIGPGTAGQVLQTNGAASAPSWVTPSSGGSGGGNYFPFTGATTETTATATIGNYWDTPFAFTIIALRIAYTGISGKTYQATVATLSGTSIAAVKGQTATWVAPSSGNLVKYIYLTAPASVLAGDTLMVVLTNKSDGNTGQPKPLYSTQTFPLVTQSASGLITLANTAPAAGQTVSKISSSNYFSLSLVAYYS